MIERNPYVVNADAWPRTRMSPSSLLVGGITAWITYTIARAGLSVPKEGRAQRRPDTVISSAVLPRSRVFVIDELDLGGRPSSSLRSTSRPKWGKDGDDEGPRRPDQIVSHVLSSASGSRARHQLSRVRARCRIWFRENSTRSGSLEATPPRLRMIGWRRRRRLRATSPSTKPH
jgi:hypothetical protein